jgi:hypothetical protein
MGNQQSSIHEPRLAAEPAKSALIRSRSIKSNADDDGQSNNEMARYPQPSPYDEHVKYPRTAPFDGSDLSSGAFGGDSPQWGWYTHHTTPPTPEYYHSRVTRKHTASSNSSSQTSSTQDSDTSHHSDIQIPVAPQPNPVFRILQNKYKANPNTWNVPC